MVVVCIVVGVVGGGRDPVSPRLTAAAAAVSPPPCPFSRGEEVAFVAFSTPPWRLWPTPQVAAQLLHCQSAAPRTPVRRRLPASATSERSAAPRSPGLLLAHTLHAPRTPVRRPPPAFGKLEPNTPSLCPAVLPVRQAHRLHGVPPTSLNGFLFLPARLRGGRFGSSRSLLEPPRGTSLPPGPVPLPLPATCAPSPSAPTVTAPPRCA